MAFQEDTTSVHALVPATPASSTILSLVDIIFCYKQSLQKQEMLFLWNKAHYFAMISKPEYPVDLSMSR
jgi:hypothetical protein